MSLSKVLGAVGKVESLVSSLTGGSQSGANQTWAQALRPASWKGVPFGVLGGQIKFGRRNAVHEYPLSDDHPVWVEDLGRAGKRITMTGFLVENSIKYGGGAVIAQRDKLIAACESEGPGQLVHPTLGTMMVGLLDAEASEHWEAGRTFEIKFVFLESGKRIFPSQTTSTGGAVTAAASLANAAAGASFGSAVGGLLGGGASVLGQAVAAASSVAGQVANLAADATSALHMVSALSSALPPSLSGSLGRYASGALSGFSSALSGVQSAVSTATSVSSLVALGASARANVSAASSALSFVASTLGI
jgi:prophage DNA circulation protein